MPISEDERRQVAERLRAQRQREENERDARRKRDDDNRRGKK